MAKLPKFLKKYFWDVDFETINLQKESYFIIERILEEGDKKAIKWMLQTFSKDLIQAVLQKSRRLSKKSANFWAVIFNIPKNKILCLKKSFQKKQKIVWPY